MATALISCTELNTLKEQIREEVLEEIKRQYKLHSYSTKTYKNITEIAKSTYTKGNSVYPDMYAGGFSTIIRNVMDVNRLDNLCGEKLDKAIELAEELTVIISKYKKEK